LSSVFLVNLIKVKILLPVPKESRKINKMIIKFYLMFFPYDFRELFPNTLVYFNC